MALTLSGAIIGPYSDSNGYYVYALRRDENHMLWLTKVSVAATTDTQIDINYRKDGTLLWCEWFNSAIKDESGRVVTVLSMAQDISVLKQTQQALEAAKELAEGANQSKSTFLANFSHEFRTPLHIILGYVQKIQKHPTCNQLFNSELKAIYTQGTYLFNLFQDLLELSKAESGRQTVNPTSCPLI